MLNFRNKMYTPGGISAKGHNYVSNSQRADNSGLNTKDRPMETDGISFTWLYSQIDKLTETNA